jgi:hypothetical protein
MQTSDWLYLKAKYMDRLKPFWFELRIYGQEKLLEFMNSKSKGTSLSSTLFTTLGVQVSCRTKLEQLELFNEIALATLTHLRQDPLYLQHRFEELQSSASGHLALYIRCYLERNHQRPVYEEPFEAFEDLDDMKAFSEFYKTVISQLRETPRSTSQISPSVSSDSKPTPPITPSDMLSSEPSPRASLTGPSDEDLIESLKLSTSAPGRMAYLKEPKFKRDPDYFIPPIGQESRDGEYGYLFDIPL